MIMGVGGIIAEMDHSSELQTRLRQYLNCFIPPQCRSVPMPTRDPTLRTDVQHGINDGSMGVATTNKYLQADLWTWISFL